MARRRRSAPRQSAAGLESLLDALAPEEVGSVGLGRIQRVWGRAVGPAVSAAGQPVALVDGVLHVGCQDATWAHELQLLERSLIAGLVGVGITDVIAVRVRAGGAPGGSSGASGRPSSAGSRGRSPRGPR